MHSIRIHIPKFEDLTLKCIVPRNSIANSGQLWKDIYQVDQELV